jgi:hypothetical protein
VAEFGESLTADLTLRMERFACAHINEIHVTDFGRFDGAVRLG